MIGLMGGPQHFSKLLDSLFTMTLADRYIEKNEDITRDGIIGSYVHGNEPGHHIPYLYNWAAKPAKTQAQVRMILRSMYANSRDGLCGNDDAGQMSAWYLFSALGFYPVCPGSDRYALGSPLVQEAVIELENGQQLRIRALDQSEENIYVKEVTFNGKRLTHFELPHKTLVEGGELVFHMSASPDSKRPVYEYKNN
jgi:predicted alpha-1,2-mannosidase